MTTPAARTISPSNEKTNIDIESGGGSGSVTSAPSEVQRQLLNEQTPLLSSGTTTSSTTPIENDSNDDDTKGVETITDTTTIETDPTVSSNEAIPATSVQQTAVTGFAGLGFVTSLISMMAEYSATAIQHPAIVISGVLGLILSPYAKFQQEKLTQVKALEQTNTVLEDELKYLQKQNEEITKHVEQVNDSTTKLRTLQSTLTTMQSANIQSIDQLEQQVAESKQVLMQFHQNTQAMVLQNLITVLVTCDGDKTMTLNDHEIDLLIQSLESIHDVQFNDTKIRQLIIHNNRSITSIMEIARNLLLHVPCTTGAHTPITTTTAAIGDTTTIQPTSVVENDSIFSYIEI